MMDQYDSLYSENFAVEAREQAQAAEPRLLVDTGEAENLFGGTLFPYPHHWPGSQPEGDVVLSQTSQNQTEQIIFQHLFGLLKPTRLPDVCVS